MARSSLGYAREAGGEFGGGLGMTEAEITHMIAMNRQAFIGWLQTSLLLTLAVFFLAYVVRSAPVYVRGAIAVVFLIGSFNFFMVMNIANEGFLRLVQDLASVPPVTGFSQGTVELLGATPSLPIWARIGAPLTLLLNLAVGFHLLLLEKWER
jgi:hypothetical protein